MAKMQEEWDAQERAENAGPGGCAIAFVSISIGFGILWIIMLINFLSSFFSESGSIP